MNSKCERQKIWYKGNISTGCAKYLFVATQDGRGQNATMMVGKPGEWIPLRATFASSSGDLWLTLVLWRKSMDSLSPYVNRHHPSKDDYHENSAL